MFRSQWWQGGRGSRSGRRRRGAAKRAREALPLRLEILEDRTLLDSYLVTTLSDAPNRNDGTTSLREALALANTHKGDDTITFAQGLSGTISLAQNQLDASDLTGATTIDGAGVVTIT